MFVYRSDLCDTDLTAYTRYLEVEQLAFSLLRDGQLHGSEAVFARLAESKVYGGDEAGAGVDRNGCGCVVWRCAGQQCGVGGGANRKSDVGSSDAGCCGADFVESGSADGRYDGRASDAASGGGKPDEQADARGGVDEGSRCESSTCAGGRVDVKGKHYARNRARRERSKRLRSAATRGFDGSGGCVSDVSTVRTVDTRTAVEIEAAQTLAERRVAENRLAVAQANARAASYADKDKSKALERLHAVRLSQRINQATAAANKAYDARDKSLTSVDSAGSAGEYALRQEIKAARNSKFLNEYLRKQNDILARYADSAALAAADRVPKPKFDDAYDVMKDQYDRADPEQVAQLDADVAVENARWNDVLNSGEGFVDEPATVKKPEVGETLEELYAKVRAEDEKFDIAQREIDAANRE